MTSILCLGDILQNNIDSLIEIKNNVSIDESKKIIEIIQAISNKNTESILLDLEKKNKLHDYYDIYNDYKQKSFYYLSEILKEQIKEIPVINIIIIIHLIYCLKNKSKINWNKKQITFSEIKIKTIDVNDIDFFISQILQITDSQNYELPSEYCERVRYLPKELTKLPGKYSYDITPYLREIVDNFSPLSPIQN